MTEPVFGNPDLALIHRFLENPDRALPIDSNPMAVALGSQLLRVNRAEGTVEIAFSPDQLFVQGGDVLQGGALAAMLDFAMAFATMANLQPDHTCATVNLNVAYLRPAPRGPYIAVGELERRGKTLAFTRAQLKREYDESIVATATSTLTLVAPR